MDDKKVDDIAADISHDDNNVVEQPKDENNTANNEVTCQQSEEVEEILSEDVQKQNHETAIALKEEGNVYFKKSELTSAITSYTNAIELCPKSKPKTLAILYGNRAACYVKKDDKQAAIEDCNKAIEFDPYYTKARLRRANMFEVTEKLDEALADYNEILKYDRSCQQAGDGAIRLPPKINERNEKMKEEMMGKLKELGNMCLKPFGLSTENFKVNQDPNSGGYSINFQK